MRIKTAMSLAIVTILTTYISALNMSNQVFAQIHFGPGPHVLAGPLGEEVKIGKVIEGEEAQVGKIVAGEEAHQQHVLAITGHNLDSITSGTLTLTP
jgi:hypothetical protein